MNAKLKLWQVLAILTAVAAYYIWHFTPASPPDYTSAGYTKLKVRFYGKELITNSIDTTILNELFEVIKSGNKVGNCRCGTLATLNLTSPNGSHASLSILPPHDDESIEFKVDGHRFRVSREWFLRVVKPMAVPEERWFKWVDKDIPVMEDVEP
jgi:hypothetical protein